MAQFRTYAAPGIYKGTTDDPTPADKNNTDVLAPSVRLYIEGVQVPFVAMSISQAYGRKPNAEIQIPPASGLMDIIRGYEPKVHIFYNDENYGGYRLLFWGVITSANYSRTRQGPGGASISFHCEHKNSVLSQITLDYAGWTGSTVPNKLDPVSSQAVFKSDAFNSMQMIIQGLAGVNGIASDSEIIEQGIILEDDVPVNKFDPSLEKHQKRLIGMPAVSVSLWNQVKKQTYLKSTISIALSAMYIPLLEESLGFFKRMSGHHFLESQVDSGKESYCNKVNGKEVKVMTPPTCLLPLRSAVQQELVVRTIQNRVNFSGELMSFDNLLDGFYNSVQYEMMTLASPAEINADPEIFSEDYSKEGLEKSTVEVIIKPQLPFYYSPICNVLLPRMYSTVNISQEEGGIPSRVTATYDAMTPQGNDNSTTVNYRGPHTIREAVAYNRLILEGNIDQNLSLASTRSFSYSIPGRYEQGRGIKPETTAFPWWLGLFSSNRASQSTDLNQEQYPIKGSADYNAMMAMTKEWKARNGVILLQNDSSLVLTPAPEKYGLNPYDPNNKDVLPHERMFFSMVDYEYTKRIVGSRSGTIDAVFNPYIIPGYPMDIIDDSPNNPSFHGMCTSVTHTITSGSIGTSIGIAAATSYAEMSNYYIPSSPPFLETALGLVNAEIDTTLANAKDAAYGDTKPFTKTASTLLQNPVAKTKADTFYRQVLGVGAASPEDLIHFESGRAYPVDRKSGVFIPRTAPQGGTVSGLRGDSKGQSGGRHHIDYYSTVGNLRLVARPIESIDSIEEKFSYNFIDLDKNLYNSTYVNYVNPALTTQYYLEPGASLFLDYMETSDFIEAAKAR